MPIQTLPLPAAAQRDTDAVQMLSAWVAEDGQHCSANVGMWHADVGDEPTAWGVLLADIVRHLGKTVKGERGIRPDETIEQIVDAMLGELNEPSTPAAKAK